MQDLGQSLYHLSLALLFIAVIMGVEGLYLWWNYTLGHEAKRIKRRLKLVTAQSTRDPEILKQRLLSTWPTFNRVLASVPYIRHLDTLLERSGLGWRMSPLLLIIAALALMGFLSMVLLDRPVWIGLLVASILGSLPVLFAVNAKRKRLQTIEAQLPNALDFMARALRVGHSFQSALSMVAEQMNDPIAAEFTATFDEIKFGIAVPDALNNLVTRVPLVDLRHFVAAVLIQRETGGNLAELLDSIAEIVRERHRLQGAVRSLSAEGRMSAWVLCLLPIVLGLLLCIINPAFMAPLWQDPLGLRVVGGLATLMGLGVLWIRALIRIHV